MLTVTRQYGISFVVSDVEESIPMPRLTFGGRVEDVPGRVPGFGEKGRV